MKKLSIMLMAACALGFTACEDDETDAIPQSNPQETIMDAAGLVVAQGAAVEAGVADLNAASQAAEKVAVLNVVETTGLPEVASVQFKMQLDAANDFTSPQEVATIVIDNVVYVAPEDWQAAHLAEFGKNPKARETFIRFAAYAVNGTSSVRIGNADLYLGQASLSVTPYPAAFFIDEVYNLEANGEVVAEFQSTGGDVYDNPNFTAKVTIAAEDIVDDEFWEWRIVAKNAPAGTAHTIYAPNADYADAMDGVLETNADGVTPGLGNFPLEGKWIINFNAETCAFTITEAPKEMYMIGGFCGWDWAQSAEMIPVNGTDATVFWTIRYVNAGEGFKFNTNTAWDGGEFGYDGATVGTCVAGAVTSDGGNLAVENGGWYIFVIDNSGVKPVLNVYEPNVYVFGAANGGTWNSTEEWKFQIVGDRDAEWPFVSPTLLATDGSDSSCLRLCVELPGYDWWKTEFIFYDGEISYRGDGGDQARVGNAAGKCYLNFVTGKAKVE